MNDQDFRNLQEAYIEVYELDEGAAGDVAARAQKLAAQRKGQTPERKQMYASLSSKASERERGGPRIIDLGGRGGRKGLTQSDRDARREYDAEYSYETGDKNSTPGPGTITKNKRKLAAQKARGQHAESFDLYDIILSHLLDEGYADTEQAAEAIMVNMSEDWRDDIFELYKGKHGQSETEYQAGRSDAGKRVSGDENTGPRHYALGRSARPDAPTKPGEKPKNTPKLANWEKDDIQYRKANLKK